MMLVGGIVAAPALLDWSAEQRRDRAERL